jgi:hypothetical protein
MAPQRAIQLLAAGIVLLALLGMGGLWYQRLALRPHSDPVTAVYPAVGDLWLLPNLEGARLMVPDRPSRPQEPMLPIHAGDPVMKRIRSFSLSTNAWRLRNPPLLAKEPGRPRILVLGDSIALGWGVEAEEALPAQLAEALDALGRPVEVLNGGVPAIDTAAMASFCRTDGRKLGVDLLIWNRRPAPNQGMIERYVEHLRLCTEALRVPAIALLHPLSTFDPKAQRGHADEVAQLRGRLAHDKVLLLDAAPLIAEAQQGRGEIYVEEEGAYRVIDQESGEVWLSGEAPREGLADEVYTLFEEESAVEEALFFDGAHPNAEAFERIAAWLAPQVLPLLPAEHPGG